MSGKITVLTRKKYLGPSFDLKQQAIVLELESSGDIDMASLWKQISEKLPGLSGSAVPLTIGELYARTFIELQQLGMNLFAREWSIREENGKEIVAVQYIDPQTGDRVNDFVYDWVRDILSGRLFPFQSRYEELEHLFYRSGFGGPTIYSIVEAGYKRNIPMFYLPSEDVFQWGQGRKQLRGRSTVLHRDSIKDTELTSFKDRSKAFLDDFGFPSPKGTLCTNDAEALAFAEEFGYPLVTKPLAGHKGQGVSTNLNTPEELRLGLETARDASTNRRDPVIVEQHVTGTDHRLLTISGKFTAALQRIPAYVDGDGEHTIEQLIDIENSRPERADTPRSALGKIKIDDDLVQFIKDAGHSLSEVPAAGNRITLRRVANISAGGVSVNVTEKIHPKNIKMAEDVARFLDVHVLGIDLLAEDISKPWDESPCAIIEINAGPGVFMHLVPAKGESIDVPGKIMDAFFPTPQSSRVPTLVFNKLDQKLATRITETGLRQKGIEEVGTAAVDGVRFNDEFFSNRPEHIGNIRNVMRNPKLDMALIEYNDAIIQNEGMYHWGADIVVLENPTERERILTRDLLDKGLFIEIDRSGKKVMVSQNGKTSTKMLGRRAAETVVMDMLTPVIAELAEKYYYPLA
ncbi:cyanophycin synthetase [bacterium]|nr:cyanophycin synthetase [candidate division CSSED10-310 bacterium]